VVEVVSFPPLATAPARQRPEASSTGVSGSARDLRYVFPVSADHERYLNKTGTWLQWGLEWWWWKAEQRDGEPD